MRFENFEGRELRFENLILRAAGVDVFVPEQNAAGHAFHVFEAVLAEDLGELHGSAAALAVDDDFFVFVAFEFADSFGRSAAAESAWRRGCAVMAYSLGSRQSMKRKSARLVEQRFHLARGDFPIGLERIAGRQAAGIEAGIGLWAWPLPVILAWCTSAAVSARLWGSRIGTPQNCS